MPKRKNQTSLRCDLQASKSSKSTEFENSIPVTESISHTNNGFLHCKDFRLQTLPKISSDYDFIDNLSDLSGNSESGSSKMGNGYSSSDSASDNFCLMSPAISKTIESSAKLAKIDDIRHHNGMDKRTRACTIPCKYSYEELEDICDEMNLIFTDYEDENDYEVDLILEDKIEDKTKMYLVKWKDYNSDTNTWEPNYNLSGCTDMINYYEFIKSHRGFNKEMVEFFVRDLKKRKPHDVLTSMKLLGVIYGSDKDIQDLQLSISEYKLKLNDILDIPFPELYKIRKKLFKIMKFAEERKKTLINLYEWEQVINAQNPTSYIAIENNVDLECAPSDFRFIHNYVSNGIKIPDDPIAFCQCENCYDCRKTCCPHNSEAAFPYSRNRRLLLLPGYPIYECNRLCKCGPDCINRNVQNGQKVRVCIFRTADGRGWGLKTLEAIPKDQFVVEYLGEIITSDEAETRGHIYDYIGRSYLFDLDYGDEEECVYTVDAGHEGNVAHFINHSCDPNLHVFAVWIDCADPSLPRLAFFSKRKIARGEELTFDYKMVKTRDPFNSSSIPNGYRIVCKCNSRNCRKYLF